MSDCVYGQEWRGQPWDYWHPLITRNTIADLKRIIDAYDANSARTRLKSKSRKQEYCQEVMHVLDAYDLRLSNDQVLSALQGEDPPPLHVSPPSMDPPGPSTPPRRVSTRSLPTNAPVMGLAYNQPEPSQPGSPEQIHPQTVPPPLRSGSPEQIPPQPVPPPLQPEVSPPVHVKPGPFPPGLFGPLLPAVTQGSPLLAPPPPLQLLTNLHPAYSILLDLGPLRHFPPNPGQAPQILTARRVVRDLLAPMIDWNLETQSQCSSYIQGIPRDGITVEDQHWFQNTLTRENAYQVSSIRVVFRSQKSQDPTNRYHYYEINKDGESFPYRGRGPAWEANTCAFDCFIVVARFLNMRYVFPKGLHLLSVNWVPHVLSARENPIVLSLDPKHVLRKSFPFE